ncbi:hypothetical protein HRbin15_02229 [bacterium HR15]|nr:hypothetical protein HRbin15_02229 [bacterium HR15]
MFRKVLGKRLKTLTTRFNSALQVVKIRLLSVV